MTRVGLTIDDHLVEGDLSDYDPEEITWGRGKHLDTFMATVRGFRRMGYRVEYGYPGGVSPKCDILVHFSQGSESDR